jgi:ferredoxin
MVNEMKVTIDRDRCIGAGQCVMNVPEVFDQDDDSGTVVLLQEVPATGLRDEVKRAVRSCPAGVIDIDEHH